MLTHSYYEEDPRVRRQAEALAAAGRPVDVFALRAPGKPASDVIGGVHVQRLAVMRHQGAALSVYLTEYAAFLARAVVELTRSHQRRRYALVVVHAPPDLLVVATAPLRMAGIPIVLDLHEATPELFRSRFTGSANVLTMALLRASERGSIAYASMALSVNRARQERLLRLGMPRQKLRVVLNVPVLGRFDPTAYPTRRFMADKILRLVYTGALTPLYELDIVVAAMGRLKRSRPDLAVRLDMYGRGDMEHPLRGLAAALGIDDRVDFHGRIPIEAVPGVLAQADVALSPISRNPFSEISLPTKIFEGAAMGKPVVAANLPIVRDTFGSDGLTWYRSGDADDLADAIGKLVDASSDRKRRVAIAISRVRELSWERESERYVALIEGLAVDGGAPS
jgi:glycosyltransferase involved in cell wall biosynthesis